MALLGTVYIQLLPLLSFAFLWRDGAAVGMDPVELHWVCQGQGGLRRRPGGCSGRAVNRRRSCIAAGVECPVYKVIREVLE